jgi:CSLREA domain-containing protein
MHWAWLACSLLATPAVAATFEVVDTDDAPDADPGDGVCGAAPAGCTLRAAIDEANALPGLDLILVAAGTYDLEDGTLFVSDPVRIVGALTGPTIVDVQGGGSVFDIDGGGPMRVELHRLTLQGGNAQSGGGLINRGGLVLIHRTVVRGNTATTEGGGVVNGDGGVMAIVRSHVTDNGDPLVGNTIGLPGRSGGIENDPGSTLFLDHSALTGNRANRFGGMRNLGLLIATNSTISGNLGDVDTGGLVNTGLAFLNNVTVHDNHVLNFEEDNEFTAGGVSNTGDLFFANSIIAGNTNVLADRQDCNGTLTSAGYDLVQDDEGCDLAGTMTGVLVGVDPLLGPLQANGGDTPTHALPQNSPARNAGSPALPSGLGTACGPTDQRFRLRGVGPGVGRCDMGAYERNAIPGEVVTP